MKEYPANISINMVKRHPQPTDILVGDMVIVIDEEQKDNPLIGRTFNVNAITRAEDGRDYQLSFLNDNPAGSTKREFLEAVQRNHDGMMVTYYKTSFSVKEEGTGFWGIIVSAILGSPTM